MGRSRRLFSKHSMAKPVVAVTPVTVCGGKYAYRTCLLTHGGACECVPTRDSSDLIKDSIRHLYSGTYTESLGQRLAPPLGDPRSL